MQLFKFLIATTLLLILSCSNLGDQSQKDLKLYRGGNAFETVFNEVLKEDKAFAESIEKVESRLNAGYDVTSIKNSRDSEGSPESFITTFYDQVSRQLTAVIDSTDRKILTDLYKINEELFAKKLQEKVDLSAEISGLETNLNQRIQKLKIKKTLAYILEYQAEKTIDVSEFTKERNELVQLLKTLEKFE